MARYPSIPYPSVFSDSASLPLSSLLSFSDVLFECLADEVQAEGTESGDTVLGRETRRQTETPTALSVIAERLWAKGGEVREDREI